MRYQGVNLAEGFSPVLLELYRLSVDPLATLEMITNENNLGGLEMTSIILPDFNQKTNTAFSYFGRLQAVTPYPTLTYNGQASYDGKYRYRGK
ncbi:hypothetical protein ACKUS5_22615 [Serratia marcescens]